MSSGFTAEKMIGDAMVNYYEAKDRVVEGAYTEAIALSLVSLLAMQLALYALPIQVAIVPDPPATKGPKPCATGTS